MIEREDIVAAILAAAGGELIGRVRLQKTAYLLEQLGLGSRFEYDYHHYGPYSRDLDNAVADAKAFGIAEEKFAHRKSDGAMYSIFELKPDARGRIQEAAFGNLRPERTRQLVGLFAKTNVTVLELAATVDWLWRTEKCADWRAEVTKRKGRKVQNGRLERAEELLRQLDLAPPALGTA